MQKILPSPACAKGWTMDGKADIYNRENLFDHIDGEAEIYFPYGFDALASARYANKENPQISVEADVYKMGSLIDAFGMYANYRRVDDIQTSIGAEGIVSPSQMLFYQDRYFVRLQAGGTLKIDKDVFLECAISISKNLPSGSGKPEQLDALMISPVVQKSERYIAQSLLGYSFFNRGLMADALTPKKDELQLFVVLDESMEAARDSLGKYRDYLQKSGAKVQMRSYDGRIEIESADPLYGNVVAEQQGKYIIGAIRFKEISEAKKIVEQVAERLLKPKDRKLNKGEFNEKDCKCSIGCARYFRCYFFRLCVRQSQIYQAF
ncbi:MAG TPA: DUF6599 family protein [Dissulfurispiraceae bacterium]|nr:DUF6599 family protein [Dissulfurispiraceae bacterium]